HVQHSGLGRVLRVVRQDHGGIWLPGVRGPVSRELAYCWWSVSQHMDVRRRWWNYRDPFDRLVSRPNRRPRLRAQRTAWLVVLVALLVFLTASQLDDDDTSSLRSTDFV